MSGPRDNPRSMGRPGVRSDTGHEIKEMPKQSARQGEYVMVIFYNEEASGAFRAASSPILVGAGFSIEFTMTVESDGRPDIHCKWTPSSPKTRRQHLVIRRSYERARSGFFAAIAARMGRPAAIIDMALNLNVMGFESIHQLKPTRPQEQCVICRALGRHFVQFRDAESRQRLNAISPGEADAFFMLCPRCQERLKSEVGREEIGEKLIRLLADNVNEKGGNYEHR